MKMNTFVTALFLVVLSSVATSAQVTMTSDWRAGVPHNWTVFSVLFTYDDAMPDSDPSDGVGVFNGSVRDIHFTYGGEDWTFDGTQPNSITLYTAHPPTMNTFQLRGGVVSASGDKVEVSLLVESGWFSTDSLSVVPEELFMSYAQLYFRRGEGYSDYTKIAEGSGGFFLVPVPVPAGIYLMSSGLLGLLALGRQLSKGSARA